MMSLREALYFVAMMVVSALWVIPVATGAESRAEGRSSDGTGQPGVAQAERLELARPGTLQEYIDRYTGDDVGCTIGGQTFRNFRVLIQTSVDESQLQGPHPSPPLRPDQIFLTPVNYVKDGRRWVGFRLTTSEEAFDIHGGPHSPEEYLHIEPYNNQPRHFGFLSHYDVRMEVHGTTRWQMGKIAYQGLRTERYVEGEWRQQACGGPCARGNLGWHPGRIDQPGRYGGSNADGRHGAWARLASVSRNLNAPADNENRFKFHEDDRAPLAFEVRANYWPDRKPQLSEYGLWFRMNGHGGTNSRWRVDYIEYSFSHPELTDELWIESSAADDT